MTRGLVGIIKLVVFVLILPIVIAVIIAFQKELETIIGNGQAFWWGVIAYTVFHLFIFTPQAFFRFWQGVFMEICSFAGTVANVLVTAVPIITTVLLLIYFLLVVIFHQNWGQYSVIFFAGFTLALHVILSAQELYELDETTLKGHYLLHISLAFIVNIIIIVLLMDMSFKRFSFLAFWHDAFRVGEHLYRNILGNAGIHW